MFSRWGFLLSAIKLSSEETLSVYSGLVLGLIFLFVSKVLWVHVEYQCYAIWWDFIISPRHAGEFVLWNYREVNKTLHLEQSTHLKSNKSYKELVIFMWNLSASAIFDGLWSFWSEEEVFFLASSYFLLSGIVKMMIVDRGCCWVAALWEGNGDVLATFGALWCSCLWWALGFLLWWCWSFASELFLPGHQQDWWVLPPCNPVDRLSNPSFRSH